MSKKFPVKWNPKDWAGLSPNGIGHQKPNHYAEIDKTIWENRDDLTFARVMPIRGHSSAQGGVEMGAYATAFFSHDALRAAQRWN